MAEYSALRARDSGLVVEQSSSAARRPLLLLGVGLLAAMLAAVASGAAYVSPLHNPLADPLQLQFRQMFTWLMGGISISSWTQPSTFLAWCCRAGGGWWPTAAPGMCCSAIAWRRSSEAVCWCSGIPPTTFPTWGWCPTPADGAALGRPDTVLSGP